MKTLYAGLFLVALVILFTLLGTLVFAPGGHENTFLLTGYGDATIVYSEDAETWTKAVDEDGNTPFGDDGVAFFANWRGGRWVAVGQNDITHSKNLAWSDDGKTWNYGTGSNFGSTSSSMGRFVEYGNNIWVAGGTPRTVNSPKLLWSKDGKEWNKSTGGAFGTTVDGTCSGIFYGGGLWLASGNDNSSGPKIWWSVNGKKWTAATGFPFGSGFTDNGGRFAYGKNRYVAVGDNSTDTDQILWYSDNGKAWKTCVHPFGSAQYAEDIKYYGGIFVAAARYASGGSVLAYSEDGINFTAATGQGNLSTGSWVDKLLPPTDGFWLALGYDSTKEAGLIYRSTDGKDWTKLSIDNFFPGPASLIQTGITGKYDKKYRTVVAGQANNSKNIYWSEDGKTFNEADNSPFGETLGTDVVLEARWAPQPV